MTWVVLDGECAGAALAWEKLTGGIALLSFVGVSDVDVFLCAVEEASPAAEDPFLAAALSSALVSSDSLLPFAASFAVLLEGVGASSGIDTAS